MWGLSDLVYTVAGVQKTTLWLRIFMGYAKQVGYAGTWGPGKNIQNTIHVLDMADIVLFVFKAAVEGRAAEGAEGFCEDHAHTYVCRRRIDLCLDFGVTKNVIAWGEWEKLMGDVSVFSYRLRPEMRCTASTRSDVGGVHSTCSVRA